MQKKKGKFQISIGKSNPQVSGEWTRANKRLKYGNRHNITQKGQIYNLKKEFKEFKEFADADVHQKWLIVILKNTELEKKIYNGIHEF